MNKNITAADIVGVIALIEDMGFLQKAKKVSLFKFLIEKADEDGVVRLSLPQLSEETGINYSTVIECLKQLREDKLVEYKDYATYQIRFDLIEKAANEPNGKLRKEIYANGIRNSVSRKKK